MGWTRTLQSIWNSLFIHGFYDLRRISENTAMLIFNVFSSFNLDNGAHEQPAPHRQWVSIFLSANFALNKQTECRREGSSLCAQQFREKPNVAMAGFLLLSRVWTRCSLNEALFVSVMQQISPKEVALSLSLSSLSLLIFSPAAFIVEQ